MLILRERRRHCLSDHGFYFSLGVELVGFQLGPLFAFALPVPEGDEHEERGKSAGDEEEPLRTSLLPRHSPNGPHQVDLEDKKRDQDENTENVIQARTSKTGGYVAVSLVRDGPVLIRESGSIGTRE